MSSCVLIQTSAVLQLDDVTQPPQLSAAGTDQPAIVVHNATFAWGGEDKDGDEPAPTLHDIDLQVPLLMRMPSNTCHTHSPRFGLSRLTDRLMAELILAGNLISGPCLPPNSAPVHTPNCLLVFCAGPLGGAARGGGCRRLRQVVAPGRAAGRDADVAGVISARLPH